MSAHSDAAPFSAPSPERLAPLFPGYEIQSHIATGGMGAVYHAVQVSLDRPVAIKILPREFGRDEEFRTNFQTEARTMARLNHPNLIGVYDFGEADGMLFIVMEFVPGKTLFHSAHGTAIAQDEAARIVSAVCDGLAHAHEHGILHRDIKPGNILLDQQARPKIGDFGLARRIGHRHQDGETIFGTPHYTAPEVLKFPDRVDARADVFSVGVLLHELLTGKLPADDPRPASAIIGCSPKFDGIIRRATHPSPDLRYARAAEMAEDLRSAAAKAALSNTQRVVLASRVPAAPGKPGQPPAGGPPSPYRAVVVPPRSAGVGVVIGLVVVAAALVMAIVIITSGPGGSKPAPVPPPPPAPAPETVTTPAKPDRSTAETTTAKDKPKPEPETAFKPDPEPKPEPAVEPEPEPEVVVEKEEPPPAMPVFDVPGFLENTARTITRKRAEPALAEHTASLTKNLDAYDRRMRRDIRDLPAFLKDAAEKRAKENLEAWRADGNRMPPTLTLPGREGRDGRGRGPGGGGGQSLGKLTATHEDYYAKQQEIDRKLETTMRQLAESTYILGITKQIERLLPDANEAPSVKLLEEEISEVKADIGYFINLMRGMDSEQARAALEVPAAAPARQRPGRDDD